MWCDILNEILEQEKDIRSKLIKSEKKNELELKQKDPNSFSLKRERPREAEHVLVSEGCSQ